MKKYLIAGIAAFFYVTNGWAQIVLLGDNAPHANMNDGDFKAVHASWRAAKQSPCWTTKSIRGNRPMGIHHATLFCKSDEAIADSVILNTNPDYQQPKAGDVLDWSFGADVEYICDASISLSLVFGDQERIVAEKKKLKGSDKTVEHFEGYYTVTEEDAAAGLPFARVTFYSESGIRIFLHYVNVSVRSVEKAGPVLSGDVNDEGIALRWSDGNADGKSRFHVYRSKVDGSGFDRIKTTEKKNFLDTTFIPGLNYTYVVTRDGKTESAGSNKVQLSRADTHPPVPSAKLSVEVFETEVNVSWTKSKDNDVAHYSVYRGDADGNNMLEIAHGLTKTSFLDFTPTKDIENSYVVYAHDYSGNRSVASEPVKAKVKAVMGASFSDLIRPMPIHKALRSDVWGAECVVPRDPDNGVEDSEWSYWGGRPVEDRDGKFHMLVTRWPANATKGHWEWPKSTVAYTVAEKPTGPYKVVRDIAYDYKDGLGHNPDIILMNDGTYMHYSLIDWDATLFTSDSMAGPWERLGTMTVNLKEEHKKHSHRYYRNLSGVHLDDGRFLFVTKAGAMMISEGQDPLGPYEVLTKAIKGNPIIPEKYRNSNYEDPVLWKDDVQYHMLINAYLNYRAIYLRSPDGINWKFDPGTAYTPGSTTYEDGTQTWWYKLERPHVIQDEFGRATHLSLAVIDVPKRDDLARDKHSSKNIIIPLTPHKRIEMLNKEPVTADTERIRIRMISEPGFNAQTDVDLASLRIGDADTVNFGGGAKVLKTSKDGADLIIEFDGVGNGITEKSFTCKLLGKCKAGDLIIAFTKLQAGN